MWCPGGTQRSCCDCMGQAERARRIGLTMVKLNENEPLCMCACARPPAAAQLWILIASDCMQAKWWVKPVLRAKSSTERKRLRLHYSHTHACWCVIVHVSWESEFWERVSLLLLFRPDTFHIDVPSLVVSCREMLLKGGEVILLSFAPLQASSANASWTCLIIGFVLSEVWHSLVGQVNLRVVCRCQCFNLTCVLTGL